MFERRSFCITKKTIETFYVFVISLGCNCICFSMKPFFHFLDSAYLSG